MINKMDWRRSVVNRDKWKYSTTDEFDFPRIIQLQTNSRCNAGCVMCPYPLIKDDRPHAIMRKSLYKKIIDECADNGYEVQYEILPFLMNEPMLDPRLPELISYARERLPNAAISIYTNGSLKSKNRWADVVHSGVDAIIFSVNGTDMEEYERVTGGLSFSTLSKNIDVVAEISAVMNGSSPELIVHMLRMGKSTQALIDLMKYWENRGVKSRTAFVENRGGSIILDNEIRKKNFLSPGKCWRVSSQIHIVENGDVILCCGDWNRDVILGNINSTSVHGVWNSEDYRAIRKYHLISELQRLPSICQGCNMVMKV